MYFLLVCLNQICFSSTIYLWRRHLSKDSHNKSILVSVDHSVRNDSPSEEYLSPAAKGEQATRSKTNHHAEAFSFSVLHIYLGKLLNF